MTEQALAQARFELRQIELFAANGPGSFTGICEGLTAARAWGKAFGGKSRGVSLLEALVNKARPSSAWVYTILDARRGEFFLGTFRRTPSEKASATCLVRAHDQAAADLRASLPTSLQWQPVEGTLVESIAEIAWKEELANCPSSAANLDAYYIRRPDTEVNWKD
jgi:tRNA A37 threonylcarbamoyladenosine modification protein TsaB